jgi:hypothetical protein
MNQASPVGTNSQSQLEFVSIAGRMSQEAQSVPLKIIPFAEMLTLG